MSRKSELHLYLRGGLGNQLFQYSAAYALANRQRMNLVIREDLLPAENDTIAGVSRWTNQIVGFRHTGRVFSRNHQPPLATNIFGKTMQIMRWIGDYSPGIVARLGWLAGESNQQPNLNAYKKVRLINHYCPIRTLVAENQGTIVDQVRDLKSPSQNYLGLVEQMALQHSVAVHIRLGDYVGLSSVYGTLSISYYQTALDRLRLDFPDLQVWLFTDSPELLPRDLIELLEPKKIVTSEMLPSPLETMLLMSHGEALIAANSSFSWWAALMTKNGAVVIAPYFEGQKTNNFLQHGELIQGLEIQTID